MYRRFQVNKPSLAGQPLVEYTLITKTKHPISQSIMTLDNEIVYLGDIKLLDGFVYENILTAMITRVRSHTLIHAGVVSSGGRGILFVGDARHGKTTLVLELIRRGFKFLSDETAALSRNDHMVYPFPRSLRIRPGTLKLLGLPIPLPDTPVWLGKLIMDIEEVQPGGLGEPVPVSHIVLLTNHTDAEYPLKDVTSQVLSIMVDRLDKVVVDTTKLIPGVVEVLVDNGHDYPIMRIRASRPMYTLSQVELLCKLYQVLILDVTRDKEGNPTFELAARLESIPTIEAVFELLKRFQGGYKSSIIQGEFGGSSTRLFMEMSTIINQAKCYRLSVGPLKQMADLVCDCIATRG